VLRRLVALCEAPADAAHDEVRRREHGAGERHKGRNRRGGDNEKADHCEGRREREDDNHPEENEGRRPFESVLHGSTTFLV
jgi:hypothetical protein